MILLDTALAHRYLGVKPTRLRQWASRGHIAVRGHDGRRNLYAAADIERLLTGGKHLCHTRDG